MAITQCPFALIPLVPTAICLAVRLSEKESTVDTDHNKLMEETATLIAIKSRACPPDCKAADIAFLKLLHPKKSIRELREMFDD